MVVKVLINTSCLSVSIFHLSLSMSGQINSAIWIIYFLWTLGVVDWNTDDADIKFSMYWPKTWFSERSFKFSSFTESTLWDRSVNNHFCMFEILIIINEIIFVILKLITKYNNTISSQYKISYVEIEKLCFVLLFKDFNK